MSGIRLFAVLAFGFVAGMAGAMSPYEEITTPSLTWYSGPDPRDVELLNLLKSAQGPHLMGFHTTESLTAENYLVRGRLYLKVEGNSAKALEDADNALAIEPTMMSAHLLKADALEGLQQLDAASNQYDLILQKTTDTVTLYHRAAFVNLIWGDKLVADGQEQEADAAFEKAQEQIETAIYTLGDNRWENHDLLAAIHVRRGNYEAAENEYAQALSKGNSDKSLLVEVGAAEARVMSRKPSEAYDLYKTAILRYEQNHNGVSTSFPPEWRIRMAAIGKVFQTDCDSEVDCNELDNKWCEWCQLRKAIEAIDAHRKVAGSSAEYMAIRAFAWAQMGYLLQARSDALKAVRYYNAKYPNATPLGTNQSTEAIMRAVLGNDHLLFRPIVTPIASPTPTM